VTDGISLKEHYAALREADQKRADDLREADQHALSIADSARAEAIALARDIQTYKDEKANELRSQIERERGGYATKDELAAQWDKYQTAHQPVLDYINSQRGKGAGVNAVWVWVLGGVGCMTGVGAFLVAAIGLALYALHSANPTLP